MVERLKCTIMRKERIEKVGHKAVISESVYNDTHRDFKGVWETEREGCEKYMGKRTWMPPVSLFGSTCLLIEGFSLDIIPDKTFEEIFGY